MDRMVIIEEENALIAKIKGDINLVIAPWLKEELEEKILGSGKNILVIDLAEVEMIDSSGIGALISVYKKLDEAAGRLIIAKAKPYVKKIFGFARLDRLFLMVEDEHELDVLLNK